MKIFNIACPHCLAISPIQHPSFGSDSTRLIGVGFECSICHTSTPHITEEMIMNGDAEVIQLASNKPSDEDIAILNEIGDRNLEQMIQDHLARPSFTPADMPSHKPAGKPEAPKKVRKHRDHLTQRIDDPGLLGFFDGDN